MAPLAIAMLAGAGLGLLKGMQNEKKNQEDAKFRATVLKYSPWTGMGDPGAANRPGQLESGLQGAALGGKAYGSGVGSGDGASTEAPVAGGAQDGGASTKAPVAGGTQGGMDPYTMMMLQQQQMQGSPGAYSQYPRYSSMT